MTENEKKMSNIDKNWFRKHSETITVIATLLGGFIWMDSKFEKINDRFIVLEKDVSVIKTVLIIKNIIPADLCKQDEKNGKD